MSVTCTYREISTLCISNAEIKHKSFKILFLYVNDCTSGGERSDSDRDRDEASEALGHLIAQMFLLRGLQGTMSPQLLISAAAKNDVTMVQRVLRDNPALVR